MINGIINVYKEKGYTSHDVVAKMRGILKIKKIGHTGTLDPEAEGVLPICIGKATKVVDLIVDKDKVYETVMKLGIVTDTQDMTGNVIRSSPVNVNLHQIKNAAERFLGGYEQIPPMYSAVKVNGRKLYELARQGKEIERKARKVLIHSIEVLDYNQNEQEVNLRVHCGKGTYIRTLLYDIGEILGCGGAMKSLLRTRVGDFDISDALFLNEIEEYVRNGKIIQHIVSVDEMFSSYPKVVMDSKYDKTVYNGNTFTINQMASVSKLPDNPDEAFLVRVYDSNGVFIGIYRYEPDAKKYAAEKMFL